MLPLFFLQSMERMVEENMNVLERELARFAEEREWSTAYASTIDGKIAYVGRYTFAEDDHKRLQWGVIYGNTDGEHMRIRRLGGYDHPVLRETRRVFNRKHEKYEKKEEQDKQHLTLTFGVEC
jgi:hypothetical protein